MEALKKAVLRTLAYADIFDYPLTAGEIYRFLIVDKTPAEPSFSRQLKQMVAVEERMKIDGQYFFLKNREETVEERQRREKWSQSKMKIAQRVGGWLRLIPSIKMVAVTGALAMNNTEKEDDIDLLIVTSRDRLWLTRLLAVCLVELVARRRHPSDLPAGKHGKQVEDKICLNMFLDEGHLQVPQEERDLFTAHEVCQLKPIWERKNTYQKFLKENQWVKQFLPNWKP